ncbi:hypothetical protein CLU96_2912 [Chryseobacterium sp. 52]|nr:hypothetical protein CLU96_2912 [Chryseobacterium sp. 52]
MEKLINPHFFNIIKTDSALLYDHNMQKKTASTMKAVLIYQFKKILLLFNLRNLNGCQHQFVFLQLQVNVFQSAFKES